MLVTIVSSVLGGVAGLVAAIVIARHVLKEAKASQVVADTRLRKHAELQTHAKEVLRRYADT